MLNFFFFVFFPYVAVVIAVIGSLYRFLSNQFSISSQSSQIMENNRLFWGSTLWHYGVVPVLLIHLAAFTIPRLLALMHSTPDLLYLAELSGKVFALMSLAGLIVLIIRRIKVSHVRVVTTPMDWIVIALLFNQILLGVGTSFFYRWGAPWFLYTATPWAISLVTFKPQPEYVASLPLIPKLHFINAIFLLAFFPFSRLVHIATFPLSYLWRRNQLVIWNRNQI